MSATRKTIPLRALPRLPVADESLREGETSRHWEAERELLLEMIAQQQRVAQAGLMTAGLMHEIMNHVAAIKGHADLALITKRPEDMGESLAVISEGCNTLSGITNTLLGFVRRRGPLVETNAIFDAGNAVEQAVRLTRPLVKQTGVTIEAHTIESAELQGDQRMLVQALVNLISNGVRACKEQKGTVTLSVSQPVPTACRIIVTDDGPGIPEEMRKLLFRPFATANAETGGNGIGMFVVRQAVRKFNGTIRVRTSPEGTAFQIDVPATGIEHTA